MNNRYEKPSVLDAIRFLFPKLRRKGVVGIIRNGAIKRVYECCICKQQDTMNARWKIPIHIQEFIANHETKCGNKLINMIDCQMCETYKICCHLKEANNK